MSVSYDVLAPRFFGGVHYAPNTRRNVLVVDKPFKNLPEGLRLRDSGNKVPAAKTPQVPVGAKAKGKGKADPEAPQAIVPTDPALASEIADNRADVNTLTFMEAPEGDAVIEVIQ